MTRVVYIKRNTLLLYELALDICCYIGVLPRLGTAGQWLPAY